MQPDQSSRAVHFSIRTGSARAVSIISPKPFFASRADMVFMVDSREIPLHHLGQNSSFWQPGIGGNFAAAERREADGKIKGNGTTSPPPLKLLLSAHRFDGRQTAP